jgi:predicted ATP-grasp superfamily ATP-dependent carboligase
LVELLDWLPELLGASLLPVRLRGWSPSGIDRTDCWTDVLSEPQAPPLDAPPALLTLAGYNGTLAAVRTLGRAGIRITIADRNRLAMSAWSRYTSQRAQCPDVREPRRFIDWLLEFGRRSDKHVLLPTSDDTAWLYSLYRAELSEHFYVASPPIATIHGVLNKATLYADAAEAGLHVPRTWFPEGPDALERCRREARFPVVVKPRTQVMFRTQSKGVYVEKAEDLNAAYLKFSRQPYEPELLAIDPSANRPMVQEFHREAAAGIYCISAYARRGRISGLRAARKLLQQPRRLGIGLCFEEAPLEPQVVAGLQRLVSRRRYSGVFEAEFIQTAGRSVLIDFNPRFYNQMAFDIARGVPLPLLAYYDALGDRRRFNALRRAAMMSTLPGRVFIDFLSMQVMLSAQRLSGVATREESQQWASWQEAHRGRCTYAVRDPGDRLPLWFAGMQIALRCLRHPRAFVRAILLNRA